MKYKIFLRNLDNKKLELIEAEFSTNPKNLITAIKQFVVKKYEDKYFRLKNYLQITVNDGYESLTFNIDGKQVKNFQNELEVF